MSRWFLSFIALGLAAAATASQPPAAARVVTAGRSGFALGGSMQHVQGRRLSAGAALGDGEVVWTGAAPMRLLVGDHTVVDAAAGTMMSVIRGQGGARGGDLLLLHLGGVRTSTDGQRLGQAGFFGIQTKRRTVTTRGGTLTATHVASTGRRS